MSVQGRIVWHDLMTNDVEKAGRFYSELFAWRIRDEGHWSLIHAAEGEEHFGAVMPIQGPPSTPAHWMPYLAVKNLDAAMEAIPASGGKLHTGKMNAGKTGIFAVAADPQGATFTAWQYTEGEGKPDNDVPPGLGHFCWDELMTSDMAAAGSFYGSVFGYGVESTPMPGMDYWLLLRDAKNAEGKRRQAAGMMKLPPGVRHPFWMSYVVVASCEATMEKAKRLGATLPMQVVEVPTIGRFTTILDPSMTAIGLLQPST